MSSLKPVYFSSGIGSSFYMGAPIVLPNPIRPHKDASFKANEYYFHCCKVAICNEGTIDMYREILEADSCAEAKRLGRLVPLDAEEVEEWDKHYSLVAMLECNLAKFQQHAHCRRWLRATGARPLVEHRQDLIWGDNLDGNGLNLLGKILEIVRARVC